MQISKDPHTDHTEAPPRNPREIDGDDVGAPVPPAGTDQGDDSGDTAGTPNALDELEPHGYGFGV